MFHGPPTGLGGVFQCRKPTGTTGQLKESEGAEPLSLTMSKEYGGNGLRERNVGGKVALNALTIGVLIIQIATTCPTVGMAWILVYLILKEIKVCTCLTYVVCLRDMHFKGGEVVFLRLGGC